MNWENLAYVAKLLHRIFEDVWFKAVPAASLIVLHFFFDRVNYQAMLAVFVLILMDSATGMFAAYKTGVTIESHKILRTAIKIAVYFLLISAAFISERALPIRVIDETIIGALAATELFSILENVAKSGFTVAAVVLTKLRKDIPS